MNTIPWFGTIAPKTKVRTASTFIHAEAVLTFEIISEVF
jgi:hypothetical protein